MPTGILENLFGSVAKIKIIRLFLLNPQDLFTPAKISGRCKIASDVVRKEISLLKKIDFVRQKTESVDEIIKLKNGRIKNRKKKIQGLKLNGSFPLLHALKNLVLNASPVDREKLVNALKKTGRIKLIILAGIFIQSNDSRVDLLLVGDAVKKGALERILDNIESEVGKEITYSIFDTREFLYRIGMYDRFVHDILDYPHEKIFNKLGI